MDVTSTLVTMEVKEPPVRVGGGKVKTVDELISKMKEASVI